MQPLSFYDDFISLFNVKFVNPIASGSLSKYFFEIQDTIYTEKGDSVFVIYFRPYKGSSFRGMKGVLQINSYKYAIQSVMAEPVMFPGSYSFRIQQNYALLDNDVWFPVELNADIYPGSKMIARSKSYIKDIKINIPIDKKIFSEVTVTLDAENSSKDSSIWNTFRIAPLTKKEERTYFYVDSVFEKNKLELKMKAILSLMDGGFPVKFLNIPFEHLMQFNLYEKYRFGFGFETNKKIAKWFSLGAYAAYGTKDEALKYGSYLKFFIYPKKDVELKLAYKKDVQESDALYYNEIKQLNTTTAFKKFFIEQMDSSESYGASLSFRALRYLNIHLYGIQSNMTITNPSRYSDSVMVDENFKTNEVGLKLRFIYKESFFQLFNITFPTGSLYPIVYVNYSQGLKNFGGDYSYSRVEGKVSGFYKTTWRGTFYACAEGGWVFGKAPFTNLYHGNGYKFNNLYSFDIDNTFRTIKTFDFLTDRFANVYFTYVSNPLTEFGKYLLALALSANAGWGKMENHKLIAMKTSDYSKGLYEAGLTFKFLFKKLPYSLDLGLYSRLGPYASKEFKNNFVFTFGVRIGI